MKPSLAKGLVAGLVGGLVGSLVMNRFQSLFCPIPHGAQGPQRGLPEKGVGRWQAQRGETHGGEDATERTANLLAGGDLDPAEKYRAGVLVHYAFGASSAALYGALAELDLELAPFAGVPFGLAVWALADEGVVPLLGLSRSSERYPASVHAASLASHCVYGLVAEWTRGAVRRALDTR